LCIFFEAGHFWFALASVSLSAKSFYSASLHKKDTTPIEAGFPASVVRGM